MLQLIRIIRDFQVDESHQSTICCSRPGHRATSSWITEDRLPEARYEFVSVMMIV
jgi:hypothetical protein